MSRRVYLGYLRAEVSKRANKNPRKATYEEGTQIIVKAGLMDVPAYIRYGMHGDLVSKPLWMAVEKWLQDDGFQQCERKMIDLCRWMVESFPKE